MMIMTSNEHMKQFFDKGDKSGFFLTRRAGELSCIVL